MNIGMEKLVQCACAAAMLLTGCRSYEGPFAHKSEEELDVMENIADNVGEEFLAGDFASADATLQTLMTERTVSFPQYELERISILLMQGKSDEAHTLMLKVREELETLFDSELEKRAISIWHGENNKVFKGDAHERATLYALLAMSFLERGAWEDAERCVKNGLLADSVNMQDEKYNSDYGLLYYLGAVASGKAGRADDAASYLSQMNAALNGRDIRTDAGSSAAELLASTAMPDAFVIAWVGKPPQYVRGGEYGEIRHAVRGVGMPYAFMTFESDGMSEAVAPMRLGDINWQALTRGGREMDTVLAQKAAVKSGMRVSRNIFLVAGYSCITTVSSNPIAEIILLGSGGTCLAIGGICHVVGATMNAKCDVRSWHCLPGEMVVMPVRMKGAEADVVVRGYNGDWDNVAISKSPLKKKGEGIAVRHLQLRFSDNAINVSREWTELMNKSIDETATYNSYEIKLVTED